MTRGSPALLQLQEDEDQRAPIHPLKRWPLDRERSQRHHEHEERDELEGHVDHRGELEPDFVFLAFRDFHWFEGLTTEDTESTEEFITKILEVFVRLTPVEGHAFENLIFIKLERGFFSFSVLSVSLW